MGWLLAIWKFFAKGGWKIFLAIGAIIGIIGAAVFVTNELKASGARQERIIELQQDLAREAATQRANAEQIAEQNQQIIDYVNVVRNNTASIGALRSQLTELESTISPNIDPSVFQTQLQAILDNQYRCMERISQGESNASCA